MTTRQTTKIRNAFANNMFTNMKLSKAQISKIIQSGRSFGSYLVNITKKALKNVAIPGLVTNLTSSTIKGFTLFISNGDINDIIRITES